MIDTKAVKVVEFAISSGGISLIQTFLVLPDLTLPIGQEILKRSETKDDSLLNRWLW